MGDARDRRRRVRGTDAVSTYIYAGERGDDTNLASTNVLATTTAGVLTLSTLLVIFE